MTKTAEKPMPFGAAHTYIYILLTKREGRTGRISARGLDSTDRAQRGPYKKDRGPIFSQCSPEQAWLIRDLWIYYTTEESKDCKDASAGSFGTVPGPILGEYWTGNRAFWLVDFSYWPSDCLSRVIKPIYRPGPKRYVCFLDFEISPCGIIKVS